MKPGYPLDQVIIPKAIWKITAPWIALVKWASGLQTVPGRQAIPAGCLINYSRRESKGKISEESNHLQQGWGGLKSQVSPGWGALTRHCGIDCTVSQPWSKQTETLCLQGALQDGCRRKVDSYFYNNLLQGSSVTKPIMLIVVVGMWLTAGVSVKLLLSGCGGMHLTVF